MTLPASLYSEEKRIGAGRYSSVFAASTTHGRVCVKRVRPSLGSDSLQGVANTKAFARELLVLQRLTGASPHIVTFHGAFARGSDVWIEMELMDCSLDDLIAAADRRFAESEIATIALAVLKGIEFCHSQGIMHRDVKPGNVVVSKQGKVKLCDFGLARWIQDSSRSVSYTPEVCTRWYKPVEVLLGTSVHTPGIDVWSFGCILGELFNLSPLFPGSSDIEQLYLIQAALGAINTTSFPNSDFLSDYGKIEFDLPPPIGVGNLVPHANPEAVEILESCLTFCPDKRWTAEQCLKSSFWSRQNILGDKELGACISRVLDASTLQTIPTTAYN